MTVLVEFDHAVLDRFGIGDAGEGGLGEGVRPRAGLWPSTDGGGQLILTLPLYDPFRPPLSAACFSPEIPCTPCSSIVPAPRFA